MQDYPRNGEGIEAYVDASDTGYTENNLAEEEAVEIAAEKAGSLNGNGHIHGGVVTNGHVNGMNGTDGANGVKEKLTNGSLKALTNGSNGLIKETKA